MSGQAYLSASLPHSLVAYCQGFGNRFRLLTLSLWWDAAFLSLRYEVSLSTYPSCLMFVSILRAKPIYTVFPAYLLGSRDMVAKPMHFTHQRLHAHL
jgi:hypothetical protein